MSRLIRGIRNASSLAVGNAVSALISVLGFMYIARVLETEKLGIWSTVGAFVGIFRLMLISGLRKVVIREGCKDLDMMHRVLERVAGLRILLIFSAVLICSGVSLFTPYPAQVKWLIVFYSLSMIPSGLEMFPSAVFEATEKMHFSAFFVVVERLLFVGVAVTLLFLGFGLKTLFVVSLASQAVTTALSLLWSRRLIGFKLFTGVHFEPALLRPALVFSLLTFLGFLAIKIDLLMISLLGTLEEVGLYSVAAKVAQQGIMLRNVTATAFFPIAVKAFAKRAVGGARLLRYSALFFAATFAGSLLISLWSTKLVTFLVGEKYAASGRILAVLIFYIGMSWAQLPFTTALQATHNERYSFWPMLITALLNAPLNFVLYRCFGVIGIAYSTIAVTAVGSLAFCIIGYNVLTRQGHLRQA